MERNLFGRKGDNKDDSDSAEELNGSRFKETNFNDIDDQSKEGDRKYVTSKADATVKSEGKDDYEGNVDEHRDVVVLDDVNSSSQDENYLDFDLDEDDINDGNDQQKQRRRGEVRGIEDDENRRFKWNDANVKKNDEEKQSKDEAEDDELLEEGGYETRSEVASSECNDDNNADDNRLLTVVGAVQFSSSNNNNNNNTNDNNSLDKANKKKYFLKLNYLFRNARFFMMKSNNVENIDLAKTENVWSTLPINRKKLQTAFDTSQNVVLIFSAKGTRKFSGFARLRSGPHYNRGSVKWHLPADFRSDLFADEFDLDWISRKDLPFTTVSYLRNPWNLHKQVKVGRDGQEIAPTVAEQLCRKFPIDDAVDLTPILRRSRDAEKIISSTSTSSANHNSSIASRRLENDYLYYYQQQQHMQHHNKDRYDARKRNNDSARTNRSSYRDAFHHSRSRPYPSMHASPHAAAAAVYINAYPSSYNVPPAGGPPRYYEPLSMLPNYTKNYGNYLTYNIGSSSTSARNTTGSSSSSSKHYELKRHYKTHHSPSPHYGSYRRRR